jgi:hypothetical protein
VGGRLATGAQLPESPPGAELAGRGAGFFIVVLLPNDSTAAAKIGFACRLLGPCQPVPLSLLAAVPRPPLTLVARHLTACRLWF